MLQLTVVCCLAVCGAVGASTMNFGRAESRKHDMETRVMTDNLLEHSFSNLASARDELIRSIVYIPGYADNFEQVDML